MKSQNNAGFDESAQRYLISSDHKLGDDLEIVRNYFAEISFKSILDVATGAGHFTKVFNAEKKFAIDLSFNMAKTALREFSLTAALVSSASEIPFKDRSFDVVGCRIALHHFVEHIKFFHEAFRVLKMGGYFVLIDSIVDVDDSYLNVIEYLRDKSHIRSYTVKEIISFCSDLFRLEYFVNIYKKHDFKEWVSRLGGSDEEIRLIKSNFFQLPDRIKDELKLESVGDNIISYTDKKGVFIFRKL